MLIGDNKVDRMHKEGDILIISEIKKSSRFKESSRYQLLYYLQTLKKMGIQAKGELLFPEEKRKETVELTPEAEEELDKAARDIRAIAKLPVPPPPKKIKFCAKCAYREYCWAEE
jgi:CRISPR-associated exonuclease Cas4